MGIKAACFGFLALNLYSLQIHRGALYRMLSDKNRLSIQLIFPIRGAITDRCNTPLAVEKNVFRVLLSPSKNYDASTYLPLFNFLSLSPEEHLNSTQSTKNSVLKTNLSWEEVVWIENRKDDFPHVTIESTSIRDYLYPEENSHILGYMGLSDVPQEHNIYVGKLGIERAFQDMLQGKMGYETVERNAKKSVVQKIEEEKAIPGTTFVSSLYQPLQTFLWERLQEFPSAAAVVMKNSTGEILACVSHPGFHANNLSYNVSSAYWKEISTHELSPLINRVFSGLYPPGSIVKVPLAMHALEKDIITEHTRISCRGSLTVGNHKFHCWKKHGHGSMNVMSALAESCDVFFYTLVQHLLSYEDIRDAFHIFGIETSFLPEFQEIRNGFLPSPQWKKDVKKEKWTMGDNVLLSIGQGALLATPLQLCVIAARTASRCMVVPTIHAWNTHDIPNFDALPFSSRTMDIVTRGLFSCVNTPQGTGFPYRCSSPILSGKTSTSQVQRISHKDRLLGRTTTQHLEWKSREHSLFCGYSPTPHPTYAMAVVLEHNMKGAAAIARDMCTFLAQDPAISTRGF